MLRALAALSGLVVTSTAIAGPLTPPAGPPSSTNLTLQQIEPSRPIENLPSDGTAEFVITASGHYHLTQNEFFTSRPAFIRVSASDVTIDLRGFSLSGNGTVDHAITGTGFNITVRNGSVVNTDEAGIELTGLGCVVEGVTFSGADQFGGIALDMGEAALVRDCTFRFSGRIRTAASSVITRCAFTSGREALDLGDGSVASDIAISARGTSGANRLITLGNGCTLNRVHATNSFNRGVFGGDDCAIIDSSFTNADDVPSVGGNTVIELDDGAVLRGVRVANWGGTGISIGSGLVENSTVRNTAGIAITATTGLIAGCLVSSCDSGIAVARAGAIVGNSVEMSVGNGIFAGETSLVADCTLTLNGGDASTLSFGSQARGNLLRNNVGIGIAASADAVIINNQLDGDNISVASADNVIESNTITDVTTDAIVATTGGNLIIKNRVSSSNAASFNIAAGNDLGTISFSPVGAGPHDNLAY